MGRILALETVSACNLYCRMCAHRAAMTGKVLEKNKISETLCDVQKLNNKDKSNLFNQIRLDGNTEPLIYKDIKWLIHECRSLPSPSSILIVTNGVLLNNDIARFLLSNNVRQISISMTGLTSDIYCEFQGSNFPLHICKKNLKMVKDNITSLIKLKRELGSDTIIELRYIMSEASIDGFIPYINYWHEQGADYVYVGGLGDGILKTAPQALGEIISYRHCQRFGRIVLTAVGDVLLSCCDYAMEPVGNVYKQSFFDIMTSDEVVKYEKAHKELDIGNLPLICVNCPCMHVYKELPVENRPIYNRYKNMLTEMTRNKKLIVWGAGAEFEIARKSYINDGDVAYIVDNNPGRWNSFVDGIEIRPPDKLKEEDAESTFVLIASMHIFSIQAQLSAMGIKYHYATQLFLDRYIESNHNTRISLQ
jgi:MoaA/NifB/PqqE/SkfB family radical SAM enzyme